MKSILMLTLVMVLASCGSSPKSSKKAEMVKPAATSTKAKKMDEANIKEQVSCSRNKDQREIQHVLNKKGCEVYYTKSGNRKKEAYAKYDLSHCGTVYDRIKTRLIDAGFSCK